MELLSVSIFSRRTTGEPTAVIGVSRSDLKINGRHLINECGVFDGRMASRYEIMDGLQNGVSYKIITVGPNNTWEIGSDLKLVVLGGTAYLKNESSSLPCDNLGNLTEF